MKCGAFEPQLEHFRRHRTFMHVYSLRAELFFGNLPDLSIAPLLTHGEGEKGRGCDWGVSFDLNQIAFWSWRRNLNENIYFCKTALFTVGGKIMNNVPFIPSPHRQWNQGEKDVRPAMVRLSLFHKHSSTCGFS